MEAQYLSMYLNTISPLIYTSGLKYVCTDHIHSDILAFEQLNTQLSCSFNVNKHKQHETSHVMVVPHMYQNGSYHTSALENMMTSPTESSFMISNHVFLW